MSILTPKTPPEALASGFAAKGTLLDVQLPPELDRHALESIARAHAPHPHGACVLDLVVAHPSCDGGLIDLVLQLGAGSSQIAHTVATSGKASVEQLRALLGSEVPSVREHAELALLEHELRGASAESFSDVLRRYRDHDTLGYAVRYRLATHPGTPASVLRDIALAADATGEAARHRLSATEPEIE